MLSPGLRRVPVAASLLVLGALFWSSLATDARAASRCAGAPGGGLTLANVDAGGGIVRAVGSDGLIARSRNLSDWRIERTPVLHDLRGVVRAGRRWVAVGDVGTVLYLAGRRWIAVPRLPAAGLRGVAARPGLVAAVGTGGTVLTSPDGISWTVASSGTSRILWGGTRVGPSLIFGGQLSTLIASATGTFWLPIPAMPLPTGNTLAVRPFLWQLAARNDNVVAVGDFGAILQGTLAGGLTARFSPTDEILRSVDVARGQWMAVGSGGVVLTSRSGSSWRLRRTPTTVDLRGVTWTGRKWVAVGDQSTVISSDDGRRWQIERTAMPCALLGVAAGERLVAVGGGGRVLRSSDGRRWSRVAPPTSNDLYAVARGASNFVAVGADGTVLTSGTGRRWKRRRVPAHLNLHTVRRIGSEYLIGGDRGIVLSSPDGTHWSRVPFPGFHSVRGFATDGTNVVAAGAGTIARRPTPGAPWSALEPLGLGRFQTGVAFGAGLFVVVGHNGEVLVSGDGGVSWTPQPTGVEVNFDTVAWTGTEFLATGEGIAIASSDGSAWHQVAIPTSRSLRALQPVPAGVVAVGDDNTRLLLPTTP